MARFSNRIDDALLEPAADMAEADAFRASSRRHASLAKDDDLRSDLEFTFNLLFPPNDAPAAADVVAEEPAPAPVTWLAPWYSPLPKVTAEEVRSSAALAAIPLPLVAQMTATIKTALARYTRAQATDISMQLVQVKERTLPWAVPASETGVFVTLSLAPERARLTLRFNAVWVLTWLDYSLGGDGTHAAVRALTVTERAMFEFLLLQVLRTLQLHLAAPFFVLEQIDTTPPAWLLETSSRRFLQLHTRLQLRQAVGLVEINASEEALRLWQHQAPQFTTAAAQETYATEKLQRYARFLPELRAALIIGQATIPLDELAELNSGDILLLPKTTLAWQEQQLTGEFSVRVGDTEQIYFTGTACPPAGDSGMQLQFAAFRLSNPPFASKGVVMSDTNFGNYFGEPIPTRMEEQATATSLPVQPDTYVPGAEAKAFENAVQESLSGFGRTIDGLLVTLQVELATRRLPLQELAQMREGQILDLGCHVTDLVNILVDGRLIARGDLVEFDGQLGVRITEIA